MFINSTIFTYVFDDTLTDARSFTINHNGGFKNATMQLHHFMLTHYVSGYVFAEQRPGPAGLCTLVNNLKTPWRQINTGE